jgi:hypothetical protein
MKLHSQSQRTAGFTTAEMVIAVGVLTMLGLVFFQVLNSGMVLSAKNMAVNSAHEEARDGVMRLTRDLHASISVPQLRDTSFAWVSSTPSPGGTPPTAAGVSFQNIASGPNFIWKDPGNANMIMIKDNPNKPELGMRMIVPAWGIEDYITQTAANGTPNHTNVWTASSMHVTLANSSKVFGGTQYAIVYYTDRVMYLVTGGNYVADNSGDYIQASANVYVPYTNQAGQRYRYENGELHFYRQRYDGSALNWQDVATVARYISSPKPFSVPLNKYGTSNNRYVAVRLTARDPKSTNRGYLATASLLDTEIDYRSRLTLYQ